MKKSESVKILNRRFVWSLAATALALAIVLMILAAREQLLLAKERVSFPAEGRLILINDHFLHIHCEGPRNQLPTVVLESGMGGWSQLWPYTMPEIASVVRVCAYDRGGHGWSETAETSRDVSTLADELYRLMVASEEDGPFVLVGASFGGHVVRMLQFQHPESVAGLVLIDPAHEDSLERLPPVYAETERQPISLVDRLKPLLAASGLRRVFSDNRMQYDIFPKHIGDAIWVSTNKPKHIAAQLAERESWPVTDKQMKEITNNLGSLPLLVISAGQGKHPEVIAARQVLHAELTQASDLGAHVIVPEMGHASFIVNPEHGRLIAENIVQFTMKNAAASVEMDQ